MKKFEYTFWNFWGAGTFELFTVDFYKSKMASYLDITICNFEFSFVFRSDKQIKEQKKWNKLMDEQIKEWSMEDFMSGTLTKKTTKLKKAKKVSVADFYTKNSGERVIVGSPSKKSKKTSKKVAAKRKTTK